MITWAALSHYASPENFRVVNPKTGFKKQDRMIDNLLNQIQALLDQRKYAEIEESAYELARENPESVELHLLLGKAAFENNKRRSSNRSNNLSKT